MNRLVDISTHNVSEDTSFRAVMSEEQDDSIDLAFDLDDELDIAGSSTDSKKAETEEEKQLRVLSTYISSVPYECETPEEMHGALLNIVAKLTVAAEARNWEHLSAWDALLHQWISLRYPFPRDLRIRLAKLFWELILVPSLEPRYTHAFASSLAKLIANKLGTKRKLEVSELTLPWEKLWEVMKPEVWPKKRMASRTRNLHNVYLHIASFCSDYFSPFETPRMLDEFLPQLTQDNVVTVVTLLAAFLPASHPQGYLPFVFKVWEAFHSYKLEDVVLSLLGTLSIVHAAGKSGDFGPDGGLEWKDIGIYSEAEWDMIMRTCLSSMSVPVGNSKGGSSTAQHADRARPTIFKKSSNRYGYLAQIIIYSLSVDGPIRKPVEEQTSTTNGVERGYLGGSKALDSLERLIVSVETYFHPSNFGVWTFALVAFVHRLASEFSARWNEEQLSSCKTPVAQRLTPTLKRLFVEVLRTPVLLAMFSKDVLATSYAHAALKHLTILEPDLIMPQLLERAFNGLESINETHRTTAAIGALSAVSAALTTRTVWLKGQRNLVPLLELCLPGIDINDSVKTISTSLFIVTALQFIKIGDLNVEGGIPLGHDAPGEDVVMKAEGAETPINIKNKKKQMSEEELEEDIVIKQSTAGFPDWVVSFFRRVFALYENLPEEGGRSNKTGGKSEEAVLKSLNSALDVVCANLSDPLFDLALNLVFEYCVSNARSNSVRSIGNLVNSMAKSHPKKTIAKFLPHCKRQIEIEITAGASSVRTTSNLGSAVPSDTTFHWNLAILRAALAYGGEELVNHKDDILGLLVTLRKAKNERGYSGYGRMVNRLLATLCGTYPLEGRHVNPRKWNDPYFERSHHHTWGKQFGDPKDVIIQWHTPSDSEIAFVLEILDRIISPAISDLDALAAVPAEKRDEVWMNDFCRTIYLIRSSFSGTECLAVDPHKTDGEPFDDPEYHIEGLTPTPLRPKASFPLSDVEDPRHRTFTALRERFGTLLHTCFLALTQAPVGGDNESADAVDASIQLVRALNIYLSEYAVSGETLSSQKKHFEVTRDMIKVFPRQKHFPRTVWIKRATLYNYARMNMYASYRMRSALDDQLLLDLVELSLSPYTRLRKHAQSTLTDACNGFRRAWRLTVPRIIKALELETSKGKNAYPDRQKGALHLLVDRTVSGLAFTIGVKDFILAILHCQSQEKPSIQKIVANIISESSSNLSEEWWATTSITASNPGLSDAIGDLLSAYPLSASDKEVMQIAIQFNRSKIERVRAKQRELIDALITVATDAQTHWRYKEYAVRYLYGCFCRDMEPLPVLASFFMPNVTSEHPNMRTYAFRAITKLLVNVKNRTFSKDSRQLWLSQWNNPLSRTIPIDDPSAYLEHLQQPLTSGGPDLYLVDKEMTGFLTWAKSVKGYIPPPQSVDPFSWESGSQPFLQVIHDGITEEWLDSFIGRWSQESSRASAVQNVTVTLRPDISTFIKSLAKMFQGDFLDLLLGRIDPLVLSDDKYKQRAGFEIALGILRGSKHWRGDKQAHLWTWFTALIPQLFDNVKPDTVTMWESFVMLCIEDRDPRRNQPLVDFIKSQQIDFSGESAFAITKRLMMLGTTVDCLGTRLEPEVPRLMKMYFDGVQTPFAEVRAQIALNIGLLIGIEWHPRYRTTADLLAACVPGNDALQVRKTTYVPQIEGYIAQFDQWKQERLPPPRVSQSTYDRVGLSLLQWIWGAAHSHQAPALFPYLMPLLPEIFKMAELNDSSELQLYSGAVLQVISSVAPPQEYVSEIVDQLINAVKTSPSWRVRLSVLPVLQIFYFRNLLNLPESTAKSVMDVLLQCLRDENVEVRETAAKTLSGVIRCSQRQAILPLKDRFSRLARRTKLPKRQEKDTFSDTLRTLHSAVLGLCALVDAYPYSVESWVPEIIETLSRYSSDPAPISTSIRKCAASFKQTHQDTWAMDQLLFNEDQMQALSTIVSGTSYYA